MAGRVFRSKYHQEEDIIIKPCVIYLKTSLQRVERIVEELFANVCIYISIDCDLINVLKEKKVTGGDTEDKDAAVISNHPLHLINARVVLSSYFLLLLSHRILVNIFIPTLTLLVTRSSNPLLLF